MFENNNTYLAKQFISG